MVLERLVFGLREIVLVLQALSGPADDVLVVEEVLRNAVVDALSLFKTPAESYYSVGEFSLLEGELLLPDQTVLFEGRDRLLKDLSLR